MRHGFTLIELIVVIAIITILAGILVPVTGIIRTKMKLTKETNNLVQLGSAIHLYANDNNGTYPPTLGALAELGEVAQANLLCPLDASLGSDPLKGRHPNWQGKFKGPSQAGISYYYEFNGHPLKDEDNSPDLMNWFYWDIDPARWPANPTWAEAKFRQLQFGNPKTENGVTVAAKPYQESGFPLLRCWYHQEWDGGDEQNRTLMKVFNLSVGLTTFWSAPAWEWNAPTVIQ